MSTYDTRRHVHLLPNQRLRFDGFPSKGSIMASGESFKSMGVVGSQADR
jgi:hypothetical protein